MKQNKTFLAFCCFPAATPDCVQLVRSLRESQISNGGLSSPPEASTAPFTPGIQISISRPDEEKKNVGPKTIKISSECGRIRT